MTDDQKKAKRERIKQLWAEYLASAAPLSGRFQHFKTEAERQQHQREVEEAQKNGAPF